MKIVYTIYMVGVEQAEMGTHSSQRNAEDFIYRHVTEMIKNTGEQFHDALKQFTVEKKEVS